MALKQFLTWSRQAVEVPVNEQIVLITPANWCGWLRLALEFLAVFTFGAALAVLLK